MAERKDIHNSEIPIVCASCEARHRGVCGALSPEELTMLSKNTTRTKHPAGKELIGETEEIRSYANVMSGVIKLSKMLEDGRQQVVGLQFAPDFLGRPFAESSAVTAEAASEVETCAFSKSTLEKLVKLNPDLEHRLLQQTLKELDEARDWMLTLGRKTAQEKVASFLYLIASHMDPSLERDEDESIPVTFTLPVARADIADFLGLTIETVSRQITKLRSDGVIEVTSNRLITIPSLKRLHMRCG